MRLHIFKMCKQLSFISLCAVRDLPQEESIMLREIFPSILLCSHKKKVVYMCGGFWIHGFSRVWEHPQSHTFRRTHLYMNLPYNIMRKRLNRPKEMNAISTKVQLRFFPPVCPFAPSIFSQVTPRHVLQL